jgi:hypothetical protein
VGRNFLVHQLGDAINAMFAAAGPICAGGSFG